MIRGNKKTGVAPYIVILAILLGITIFMLGFGFGNRGSGGKGEGSSGVKSAESKASQPPQKKPETQASQTSSEFVVKIDKSTYILPSGERVESATQLIDRIRELAKPNLIFNAKQSSIQGSSQIKKALNEAGIPYKWEE